jgi:predicted phage terminase large subunit-like protein
LLRGDVDRLLIIAPPGCGTTFYVSRQFPPWALAHTPGLPIITASHTATLSEENSAHVQRLIGDHADVLGYTLSNDRKDLWHVSNGGQLLATSIGGTVRGFRAGLVVIDDPIKSLEEARSEPMRAATWFVSDLSSRLLPGGKIVIIATPLTENDLIAQLLRSQPDRWRVIRLPAFAEADDILGRALDEPLWSDDPRKPGYPDDLRQKFIECEQHGLLHTWYSQYQGRPRPPEGAMFKPQNMPIIEPAMQPSITIKVRAWDLASSMKGDFTVGLLLGRLCGDRLPWSWIVLDIIRFRGPPEQVRHTVQTVTKADGYGTKVWIPRDPAQAGADQADSYIRMLAGYPVAAERVSGDKVVRADAAASQANIGRIAMVRAPWNHAFVEELASFPVGLHDDQIDALSLAFSKLENDPLAVWMRL